MQVFKKFEEIDQNVYLDTYFEMAQTYQKLDAIDGAREVYGKILSDYPGSSYAPQVTFALADLENSQGRANEALDLLTAYFGKDGHVKG